MEASNEPSPPPGPLVTAAGDGVIPQVLSLWRALCASRHRRTVGLLAAGIVLAVCLNTIGQIRLNSWQGAFYDAIEQRHVAAFATQLLVFVVIAGGLLVLVVSQTWLQEMVKIRLREWLTHDLLDQWLAPQRAYMLSFAGQIGVNPDQRIHQDAQHLTELTAILAIGLLQSSLLLVSFVGVLWVLSAQVVFNVGGESFMVPGYMVWCALAYSLGGSLLAWRVGRPLIPLNAERYAREADLRFALVRVNEHADGIVLHGGEDDERRMLDEPLDRVITMMARLAGGLARLTWITSSSGWLAIVVPIVVAAPGYFDGELSFGALMMVIGAFNQVQSSLRWFVDNLAQIADWRATLLRIAAFRDALPTVESIGEEAGHITLVDGQTEKLVLDDVGVALPDECATLEQARVEVGPGERIQILGKPGTGKSALFRALAGMWPWGTGTIHLPQREAIMFMPQRPYLPPGTLRAGRELPRRARPLRRRGRARRARAGRSWPPRAVARPHGALGPAAVAGRAAAPGLRATAAPCAALDHARRRDRRPGRGPPPARALDLRARACRRDGAPLRPRSRAGLLLGPHAPRRPAPRRALPALGRASGGAGSGRYSHRIWPEPGRGRPRRGYRAEERSLGHVKGRR